LVGVVAVVYMVAVAQVDISRMSADRCCRLQAELHTPLRSVEAVQQELVVVQIKAEMGLLPYLPPSHQLGAAAAALLAQQHLHWVEEVVVAVEHHPQMERKQAQAEYRDKATMAEAVPSFLRQQMRQVAAVVALAQSVVTPILRPMEATAAQDCRAALQGRRWHAEEVEVEAYSLVAAGLAVQAELVAAELVGLLMLEQRLEVSILAVVVAVLAQMRLVKLASPAAPASSSSATSVRLAPLAEPSRRQATTPCTRSRHRELSH
jgi:hypothetical protein